MNTPVVQTAGVRDEALAILRRLGLSASAFDGAGIPPSHLLPAK